MVGCHRELEPYKTPLKSPAEPFHYLANMMHPKHMGKRLNDAQEKLAEDWIPTVNPSYLPLVMTFQIQDKIYPVMMFKNDIITQFSAAKWWRLMQKKWRKV